MKVLFISSYKNETGISPFVKSQGDSLTELGIEVSYFLIRTKGITGYIKSIFLLRSYLNKNKFDIYHAHYSFSGFVASFAGCKPLIVSLLGSDVLKSKKNRLLIRFFTWFFKWEFLIVKSQQMKEKLGIERAEVLPNGVDMKIFIPMEKEKCRNILGWSLEDKIILFNGSKTNSIKNFSLAEQVVSLIPFQINLKTLTGYNPTEVSICYNACDVFLSTSLWEGSPNTIKEAMACNTPIVATRVGDIPFLFGENSGNKLGDFSPQNLANHLVELITNDSRKSNFGRNRLLEIKLQREQIALRLLTIYAQ